MKKKSEFIWSQLDRFREQNWFISPKSRQFNSKTIKWLIKNPYNNDRLFSISNDILWLCSRAATPLTSSCSLIQCFCNEFVISWHSSDVFSTTPTPQTCPYLSDIAPHTFSSIHCFVRVNTIKRNFCSEIY